MHTNFSACEMGADNWHAEPEIDLAASANRLNNCGEPSKDTINCFISSGQSLAGSRMTQSWFSPRTPIRFWLSWQVEINFTKQLQIWIKRSGLTGELSAKSELSDLSIFLAIGIPINRSQSAFCAVHFNRVSSPHISIGWAIVHQLYSYKIHIQQCQHPLIATIR